MGKNKLQKFSDMDSYPHVFQYPFGALQEKGFDMQGRWNELFFKNNNPIVLELGCGKGEYATGLARKYPDKNFIGIDIKGARMWTGAKEAIEEEITNVAFLRTHIELIDRFFSEGEISEIWITFPDPQMKKNTQASHLYAFHGVIPKDTQPFGYHTPQKRQSFYVHIYLRDGKSQ